MGTVLLDSKHKYIRNKLIWVKNIHLFTKMISKISCVSNLWLILFIFPFQTYFILSSPVPEFEFPKSGISFSTSDENDEYKDISRCLNEEDYSMPYFDPKTRQFPCYKLLTQGPCDVGQLFVLDEEIRFSNNNELPTTKCIDRECDPIPVVHENGRTSTQETVMFNGKCTNVTSSDECVGDHEVVFVNPFGEGECGCKDGFTKWNSKDGVEFSKDSKCYQEYLQGPCNNGYQLTPKEDIELMVTVNNRTLETPVWFSLSDNQVSRRENALNDFGSLCIPSDCAKEGYVRLKSEKCIKPAKCNANETMILSTFHGAKDIDEREPTSCCVTDEEIHFRRYVFSEHLDNFTDYETKVKEVLQRDACADYHYLDTQAEFGLNFGERFGEFRELRIKSALVTIPESCPRGQTITHDGECKHVRIWRSRPRRSSNSASRIRQMMRYVRALKRQRPGLE